MSLKPPRNRIESPSHSSKSRASSALRYSNQVRRRCVTTQEKSLQSVRVLASGGGVSSQLEGLFGEVVTSAVGGVLEVALRCHQHVFMPRPMIAVGILMKGLHATLGKGAFLRGIIVKAMILIYSLIPPILEDQVRGHNESREHRMFDRLWICLKKRSQLVAKILRLS